MCCTSADASSMATVSAIKTVHASSMKVPPTLWDETWTLLRLGETFKGSVRL